MVDPESFGRMAKQCLDQAAILDTEVNRLKSSMAMTLGVTWTGKGANSLSEVLDTQVQRTKRAANLLRNAAWGFETAAGQLREQLAREAEEQRKKAAQRH
jgi:uncharacterized protein YukE